MKYRLHHPRLYRCSSPSFRRGRLPITAGEVLKRANFALPLSCQNVLANSLPKRVNPQSELQALSLKIEAKLGFYAFRAECLRVVFYAFRNNDLRWLSRVGQQLVLDETRLALARTSSASRDCIDLDLMAAKYLSLHPTHNLRVTHQIVNPLFRWAIQRAFKFEPGSNGVRLPYILPTNKEIGKIIRGMLSYEPCALSRSYPIQLGRSPTSNPLGIQQMKDTSRWRDLASFQLYDATRAFLRSGQFKLDFAPLQIPEGGYRVSKGDLQRLALVGDALFMKISGHMIKTYMRDLPPHLQQHFFVQAIAILNANVTMGTILDSQGYFSQPVSMHNAGSHFEAMITIFHELNLKKLDVVYEWVQGTFAPILDVIRAKFVTMDMTLFEPAEIRPSREATRVPTQILP